jgi:hypothetical protein
MPLQQLCQVAFLIRVEMCDDDKGHIRIVGQSAKEGLQRRQPSGRGADAYDG